MDILWRGDEYEFTPRTLQGGKDKWNRNSNILSPIFGADTESVQLSKVYEPQLFTFSDQGGDYLEYLDSGCVALIPFLTFVHDIFMEHYFEDHTTAFIFFHNLEYDWLQLVKNDPRLLEMARIGVGLSTDFEIGKIGSTKIMLKKDGLFSGSAPHFTIRFQTRKTGFNLFFRDTFSFFPGSLDKIMKDLKLPVKKMERQEDIGQIDFRGMEKCEKKIDFEEYAKIDARGTRIIGESIRALHQEADMKKMRPSAPGYAINLLYHMMDDEEAIISGVNDQKIMQLIFDTYRGGRTGGIYHGPVENLDVYDFHSSYPASMLSLPSFSPEMAYVPLDDLSLENVMAILEETGNVFMRVSGIEHDPLYPSLITTHNGMLTPIYGEFHNIATTGVEALVGIRSGTLELTEIHECVVLLDMNEETRLPFRMFARSAYERKAKAEKGNVEYTSAKLALNSSYGKLIESRTTTLVGATDAATKFPFLPGMEKEFGNYYYQTYIGLIDEDGNRKSLDDAYDTIMDEIISNFSEEDIENMVEKMFGDFSVSGKVYGRNVVPAAASLITATSRARLCAFIKATGALYWDTDSGFLQGNKFTPEELQQRLDLATSWLPPNVCPIRIGDELGDLDCEVTNASGWLAGTKRYYLTITHCPKCGQKFDETLFCKKCEISGVKCATHGIPAMPKDYREGVISTLASGTNYTYESKPKPMKSKEVKAAADIGSFRSKKYTSKFHLDERLLWTHTDEGWIGSIKPFADMDIQQLDTEIYADYLMKLNRLEGMDYNEKTNS